MKEEDIELMKKFENAEEALYRAQQVCNNIREQLQKKGLLSFKEFFKPYIGKCFKQISSLYNDCVSLKILEHKYSFYCTVLKISNENMCTEVIALRQFPELYEEISEEDFQKEGIGWFMKQLTQWGQEIEP